VGWLVERALPGHEPGCQLAGQGKCTAPLDLGDWYGVEPFARWGTRAVIVARLSPAVTVSPGRAGVSLGGRNR
jgi:hypothetical protein